jgi:hypothetical protein
MFGYTDVKCYICGVEFINLTLVTNEESRSVYCCFVLRHFFIV